MKAHGKILRTNCPICDCADPYEGHWRIPFSPVKKFQVSGASTSYLPILDDEAEIYCWDICQNCNTTFLNPYDSHVESYHNSMMHADCFVDGKPPMEGGYLARWEQIRRFFNPGSVTLLDAACGAGQYLWLAHEDDYPWDSLTGIDLSLPSAEAINEAAEGSNVSITAKSGNLEEALDIPSKYDFIIFSEAFEHVEHPRTALRNLASALNLDGRIYLTAQAPHGNLPIRWKEPIYTTEEGLRGLLKEIKLHIIHWEISCGRWTVVAEKRLRDPE